MSWKSTYNGYNPSKAAGFINPGKVVCLLCTLANLTVASRAAGNPSPAHQALSQPLLPLFFFFWHTSPNQAVNFSSLFMEITCLLTCEGNVLYAREAQEPRTSSL